MIISASGACGSKSRPGRLRAPVLAQGSTVNRLQLVSVFVNAVIEAWLAAVGIVDVSFDTELKGDDVFLNVVI